MAVACDRAGTFRGKIVEYGLKEFKSGAVSVKYRAELTEIYDFENEQWMPCEDWYMEVWGDAFVVGKEGKLNESAVKSLMANTGWNGQFSSIQNEKWAPTPCQFKTKEDTYDGKSFFKADYINHYDDVPGGQMPKLDDAKIKSLDEKYGKPIRAWSGNANRNQPAPPASRPTPPPPQSAEAPPNDEIPF